MLCAHALQRTVPAACRAASWWHGRACPPLTAPPWLRCLPPHPSHPLQEAKALQAKQRQLEDALEDSRFEARAAAAQQEQIAGLAAELAAALREAAAASEQLTLAHGRGATLEKAYAAAMQVGGA